MTRRILRLPAEGRLLVCTDLQGNLADFRAMLERFRAAPERTVLVFTGDLVHGPDEATVAQWPDYLGTPYRDESPQLLEELQQAQAAHPGRIHCLLGNHEHAHAGGPVVAKFHEDEAKALDDRLGPARAEQVRSLFGTFPLVAVAPNGVVLSHGAPAARLSSPEELEEVRLDGYEDWSFLQFAELPVLGPLLWARGAGADQAREFLAALGGTVSLYGHDVVREGYDRILPDRLCVSTSFGLLDEHKTYVELDLGKRYGGAADLREGVELLRLYPSA